MVTAIWIQIICQGFSDQFLVIKTIQVYLPQPWVVKFYELKNYTLTGASIPEETANENVTDDTNGNNALASTKEKNDQEVKNHGDKDQINGTV